MISSSVVSTTPELGGQGYWGDPCKLVLQDRKRVQKYSKVYVLQTVLAGPFGVTREELVILLCSYESLAGLQVSSMWEALEV